MRNRPLFLEYRLHVEFEILVVWLRRAPSFALCAVRIVISAVNQVIQAVNAACENLIQTEY